MQEVKDILAVRSNAHGDFNVSSKTQGHLMDALQRAPGWDRCNYAQRRAIHLIVEKLTRIVHGNPDEQDHWADIAGYATLGGKSIEYYDHTKYIADKFQEEGV